METGSCEQKKKRGEKKKRKIGVNGELPLFGTVRVHVFIVTGMHFMGHNGALSWTGVEETCRSWASVQEIDLHQLALLFRPHIFSL